jgi:hypothetical protein
MSKSEARSNTAVPLGGKIVHYAVSLGLGQMLMDCGSGSGTSSGTSSGSGLGSGCGSQSSSASAASAASGLGSNPQQPRALQNAGITSKSARRLPKQPLGSRGRAGTDYAKVLASMFGSGGKTYLRLIKYII